jgi:hypothetical protein
MDDDVVDFPVPNRPLFTNDLGSVSVAPLKTTQSPLEGHVAHDHLQFWANALEFRVSRWLHRACLITGAAIDAGTTVAFPPCLV